MCARAERAACHGLPPVPANFAPLPPMPRPHWSQLVLPRLWCPGASAKRLASAPQPHSSGQSDLVTSAQPGVAGLWQGTSQPPARSPQPISFLTSCAWLQQQAGGREAATQGARVAHAHIGRTRQHRRQHRFDWVQPGVTPTPSDARVQIESAGRFPRPHLTDGAKSNSGAQSRDLNLLGGVQRGADRHSAPASRSAKPAAPHVKTRRTTTCKYELELVVVWHAAA